jgi:hypothetical protein
MYRSNWLFALRKALRPAFPRRRSQPSWRAALIRRSTFEPLEERTPLAVLTVNSTLDNNTAGDGMVTLREAIIAANTNAMTDLAQTGSGADTIEFAPTVFGTIALTFGEMIITESLTINGPGRDVLTIDAQRNSRIFNVTAQTGNYTFRRLTLTGGNTTGEGGAIRVHAGGPTTTLTVDQCKIDGNTSVGHGGGI